MVVRHQGLGWGKCSKKYSHVPHLRSQTTDTKGKMSNEEMYKIEQFRRKLTRIAFSDESTLKSIRDANKKLVMLDEIERDLRKLKQKDRV